MKKILFLIMMLVVTTAATKAQEYLYTHVNSSNAALLQPAGSYIYFGDQAMNKKQCADFLKTHYQPAYEKFQNGLKCYQAGWGLVGAGLACELAGSLMIAFAEDANNAMIYSGDAFVIAGSAAILAALPTIFVGYSRMNQGIDMFNMHQVQSAPRAYWTIQGSENGIGLALNF